MNTPASYQFSYLRTCIFRPYIKGQGPSFGLTLWDTHKTDGSGKSILRYRLTMNSKTLFEGRDFHCSPLHAIDSDSCVESLMSFLTLRPGDTDADYFASYTPEQLEYVSQHAEALGAEVSFRFCDEKGNVKTR